MHDDADDLIGESTPGEQAPRVFERVNLRHLRERDQKERGRRKRKYPWTDEMQHGDAQWIPHESPSGGMARTIRNRSHVPGSAIRYLFRAEQRDGVDGMLVICVDVRKPDGAALQAPLRS